MGHPKNIMEISRMVGSGELDPVEFIGKTIEEAKKVDSDFHYINEFCESQSLDQARQIQKSIKEKKAKGSLLGVPVSVKDCICVKGVQSRAGSAILNGYRPLFDATAIAKLKAEGAIIIGKTAQDEFGFGGFNLNVGKGFRIPKHPLDSTHSTGGSSGGSAGLAKALSIPHLAVAESTGGSIANPASFCGVASITPTYGLVSRYGLIDYASSFDKIGTITKTMEESAYALDLMAGFDELDATSVHKKNSLAAPSIKGLKVGVLSESFSKGVDPQVQEAIQGAIESLQAQGAKIDSISLPKTQKFGISSYYVLAMAAASTNLAKFCGMRYGATHPLNGAFNEYFSSLRSHEFGEEAKRRIMLGTFARMAGFRDAYYMRAATVRDAIIKEYKAMFNKVDVIVSPAMPLTSPKISDVEKLSPLKQYMMDSLTVGPNLAGLPHATVPIKSKTKLPVGFMAVADHFNEAKAIGACLGVEQR